MPVGRTLLWAHGVGLILIGVSQVTAGGEPVMTDMVAGGAAGIFGLLGLVFLYTGLARARAAVVAPSAAVVGAVLPVGVGVIGGEAPGSIGWLGVAVAVPAIYLVSKVTGLDRRRGGVGLGLTAGLFFGGYFIALAQAGPASEMWPVVASRGLTVTLLLVAAVIARRQWLRFPSRQMGHAVVWVGVLDLVGNIAYLLAAQRTSLVVVAVVASLYPAFTVVLSRIVNHEHLAAGQVAGLVLAVVAVALLSTA